MSTTSSVSCGPLVDGTDEFVGSFTPPPSTWSVQCHDFHFVARIRTVLNSRVSLRDKNLGVSYLCLGKPILRFKVLVDTGIIMIFAIILAVVCFAGSGEAAECACATDALNVRNGAGTSHTVVATVPVGTCMPYDGTHIAADGYTWFHVTYNGQAVYAASNWLNVQTCGGTGTGTTGTGKTDCYGDVNHLQPSGKGTGGVAQSHSDLAAHISHLNIYKSCMDQVASNNCIEASIIGAIASRETGGGAFLTADGVGMWDHNGYGIMQCDLHTSGLPCRDCAPTSCCHIEMLIHQKVIPDIHAMQAKFPSWPIERQVQAAIAAYNTGRSRVHDFPNIDAATTGHDYSNDVIAQAQYLKNHYGWS